MIIIKGYAVATKKINPKHPIISDIFDTLEEAQKQEKEGCYLCPEENCVREVEIHLLTLTHLT